MHHISSALQLNRVVALLVFLCAPNIWGSASLGVSMVLTGVSAHGVVVRGVLLWPSVCNGCVSGVFVECVGRLLARATNCRPSWHLSPSRCLLLGCLWILCWLPASKALSCHVDPLLSVTPRGSQGGREFGPVPQALLAARHMVRRCMGA
ncbi:hypothetical protein SLA2020_067730 [Shorea laevis]